MCGDFQFGFRCGFRGSSSFRPLGHIRPSTTNLLMGLSVKFATNLAILLWNTDIAWILVSILVSKVLSLIKPRAFVASSASPNSWSSTGSTPWHLDSAAIDHIATDVHNLDYYQPYLGHE